MLGRVCTAVTTALAGALTMAFTSPVPAAPVPHPDQSWVADLAHGHAHNVVFSGGTLRLTARSGLITLPPQRLAAPVARIVPAVTASAPRGTVVEVDVRGLLTGGRWSEWLPTTAAAPATLPGPATLVQVRVLLASGIGTDIGGLNARPDVRSLRLTAPVAHDVRIAAPPGEPASYQVIGTREGLVDGRTANGHQIRPHDLFVALPSHRALADTDTGEYTVKVCSRLGYCAWAPVWDIGPWNINDDYWSSERENFTDLQLSQGVPEAQAAYRDGANGGKDGMGRKVTNAAGIDLSDGVYSDVLQLRGNAQVTVSYLWTGATALSTVDAARNLAAEQGGTPANSAQAASLTNPGRPGDSSSGSASPAAGSSDPSGSSATTTSPGSGGSSGSTDSSSSADGKRSSGRKKKGSDDGDSSGPAKDSKYQVVVRTAPDPSAPAAGIAADHAGVPVRCQTSNGWLRIDPDAYLPAAAVALTTSPGPC